MENQVGTPALQGLCGNIECCPIKTCSWTQFRAKPRVCFFCALHSTLYTLHSTLYTLHSTVHSLHSTFLCTRASWPCLWDCRAKHRVPGARVAKCRGRRCWCRPEVTCPASFVEQYKQPSWLKSSKTDNLIRAAASLMEWGLHSTCYHRKTALWPGHKPRF